MLKRAGNKNKELQQDLTVLLETMDYIINGNFQEIDTAIFHNPLLGEKLNTLINTFKTVNNPVVMRLNDTMEAIGDNALMKDTIEQVQTQTKVIQDMESTSTNLETSITNISKTIGEIRNHTHEIISNSKNITNSMNESMDAVNFSSRNIQAINTQVQEFKGNIDKISEIVSFVKNVANQSNLLALNASIEAARAGETGRGFAVVAEQVRQLSANTSSATQDIVNYVEQLKNSIEQLASTMSATATDLIASNQKASTSLQALDQMNVQMYHIKQQVDSIYDDIDTQMDITSTFTKQMDAISKSYLKLSDNCIQSGIHVFQVGRYLDKTRSDLVRGCSSITDQDWLRVFEVDHFILTWRVYNNIVGFEHLQKKQVDNPNGCKLGKWIQQQTDKALTQSAEFKELIKTHNNLHKYATDAWSAKEEGNERMALSYFLNTYDAFNEYQIALKNLKNKMQSLGCLQQTKIMSFQETFQQ